MTINVDTEREAVAHLLYRFDCKEQGFEDEWTEADWDELLVDSEREEYRRKAMLLMDSMVGMLTVAWQRLDEADETTRALVAESRGRDGWINDLADALGEALEIIDELLIVQDPMRVDYQEKITYFESLAEGAPHHDSRCTILAHHPECPDWRLPV